jgi:hypothetical protein
MSSVASAMCCTPGPAVVVEVLVDLRLLLAAAGSLIGNLMRSFPLAITFDISDEYSVEMSCRRR